MNQNGDGMRQRRLCSASCWLAPSQIHNNLGWERIGEIWGKSGKLNFIKYLVVVQPRASCKNMLAGYICELNLFRKIITRKGSLVCEAIFFGAPTIETTAFNRMTVSLQQLDLFGVFGDCDGRHHYYRIQCGNRQILGHPSLPN